jgi:hypothetical protein
VRSDPLIVSCCFVYGIILVNCVLYDRGVNVPELPSRLVKEIRNWKNQILLAIDLLPALLAIGLMKPSPSSIPGRRFPESAWGSSFLRHGHREGGLRCQGRFPEGRGLRWSYPDQDCHAERPTRPRSTRSADAPGRTQINYRHLKEGGRRA